jgi:ATP-dependent DNA ligase
MVLHAINQLKLRSTILDGEIVALDAEGIPRFQLLQQWQKRPTAPVVYFLFDVLWSDGRDLTGKTVLQRRERLQEIIRPVDGIQVGSYVENRGIDETVKLSNRLDRVRCRLVAILQSRLGPRLRDKAYSQFGASSREAGSDQS